MINVMVLSVIHRLCLANFVISLVNIINIQAFLQFQARRIPL